MLLQQDVGKQARNGHMVPGKTEWRFWVEFHLFSTHFLLFFCRWYPIRHFSAHMFMDSAYFLLFSAYFCWFSPILCLKWYPILVINSSMVPHLPFTDSAYFLPFVTFPLMRWDECFCLFTAIKVWFSEVNVDPSLTFLKLKLNLLNTIWAFYKCYVDIVLQTFTLLAVQFRVPI